MTTQKIRHVTPWPFALLCAAAILTPIAGTTSASLDAPGASVTFLANFNDADGNNPYSIVQGMNGNLYGTTGGGGGYSSGVIFDLNPNNVLIALYAFCEKENCSDGAYPNAGLVLGNDGDLYGTTSGGGGNESNCAHDECGTFFRFTEGRILATLYSFCQDFVNGLCLDGNTPEAVPVQSADGNFYGTTYWGGTEGYGTAFKISPDGKLTTLHNFGYTGGHNPDAALLQGSDGNFYGTTSAGGPTDGGTVFRITPEGKLTTLHEFGSVQICCDGKGPNGLVAGPDGNFYGPTLSGGFNGGGTVFRLTPTGTLTTLHYFDGRPGANPGTPLVVGSDGNLYGTTTDSRMNHTGQGTIFRLRLNGEFENLYGFSYPDGLPNQLVQDTNGNFYGSTTGNSPFYAPHRNVRSADVTFDGRTGQNPRRPGGLTSYGTLFELSVGLGPFVEANPAAAKVDAKIGILGTDLTGATSVTFHGIAASFDVKSPTLIVATIPSGATTGKIQVVTPNATLSSNVPFVVLP